MLRAGGSNSAATELRVDTGTLEKDSPKPTPALRVKKPSSDVSPTTPHGNPEHHTQQKEREFKSGVERARGESPTDGKPLAQNGHNEYEHSPHVPPTTHDEEPEHQKVEGGRESKSIESSETTGMKNTESLESFYSMEPSPDREINGLASGQEGKREEKQGCQAEGIDSTEDLNFEDPLIE